MILYTFGSKKPVQRELSLIIRLNAFFLNLVRYCWTEKKYQKIVFYVPSYKTLLVFSFVNLYCNVILLLIHFHMKFFSISFFFLSFFFLFLWIFVYYRIEFCPEGIHIIFFTSQLLTLHYILGGWRVIVSIILKYILTKVNSHKITDDILKRMGFDKV